MNERFIWENQLLNDVFDLFLSDAELDGKALSVINVKSTQDVITAAATETLQWHVSAKKDGEACSAIKVGSFFFLSSLIIVSWFIVYFNCREEC